MHKPTSPPPRFRRALGLALVPTLALGAAPAMAAGTQAGTTIRNTASASFDGNAGTTTITSNTVEFKVDEVLDVAVAGKDSGDASTRAGATGQVRTFTVTNAGNGAEGFRLVASGTVGGNGFNPTVTSIVLDSNNNGIHEPGVDQVIAADGTIAAMNPDDAVTVFVISTVPADAANGQRGAVSLTATALTGSGAPGITFAGQGTGGGDAVVGATRSTALAAGAFVLTRATVTLVKSATVVDPFGGSRAVPGSLVTYRIAAAIGGSGSVAGLRVTDTIPTGTKYRPGTLTLNGTALTDGADSDAGVASATGIDANLGTQAAGQNHTVQFTVVID
ncbi:hypothetical protein [Sphingomonas sp.]|jgi:uncharacterized repeat protein (TIGR01451 family)|uniref:hypothetical protein n=1 Tax=Sphingomonas sp. TaxID=28214 RepID=UPI002D7E1A12|nr:hypothetical protein [Sphingomonas sp.]HEU0045673.1 hypothetical protein [Sphingomonas sp.]